MNPTNLTRRCLSVFVLVSTLLCLPILLGTSFAASAQTTAGRLVVTVKDPTDAVVAGATVTATNEGTTQSITVTTNEKGVAIFPQLLVGNYTVVAEAEGFQKTQTEGLKIDVGQEYGAVLVLQPGVAENIITVTAGEALVQTTNAELASTVNQKQVQELPLDGRNPLALIQLQAGVNQSGNTTTVINGFRTSTSTLTQDGINIQDNFIRANGLDFTPNRTSVAQTQEFTVITQNPDASIAGSSSVRGVSPSGTNELHGSAFEFHRNDAVGANTFFNNASKVERPKLIRNQFGFTLSGPVVIPKVVNGKDKLFFFGFYEGFRERAGNPSLITTLLPNARQGVFTYRDNQGQTRTINVLGLRDLSADPFMQNIISRLPGANTIEGGDGFNTAGFRLNQSDFRNRNVGGGRIDYSINASHRLEGVYNYTNEKDARTDIDSINQIPKASTDSNVNFAVGAWNWQVNNNLNNEVRIGGNRSSVNFNTSEDPFDFFTVSNLFTDPIVQFQPQGRTTTILSFIDNAAFTKGDHFIRFGGQFDRTRVRSFNFGGVTPVFGLGFSANSDIDALTSRDFPGGIDAFQLSIANGLLADVAGVLANSARTFNVTSQNSGFVPGAGEVRNFQTRAYSSYITDSWRIHPRLTVNAGLRYDYYTPLREENNLALLPVTNGRGGRETVLDPNGTYDFVDGFYNSPDRNNFAPSVSVAWDIPGLGRQTVLRGGYSLTYVNDEIIRAADNAASGNDGLQAGVSNTAISGLVSRDALGLIGSSLATPEFKVPRSYLDNFNLDPTSAAFLVDPELVTPYYHQWNVSLERELSSNMSLAIRYVGNRANNLVRGVDFNQLDVVSNGFAQDVLRARSNGFLALAQNGRFDPRFNPNIAGSQQLLVFPKLTAGGLLTNTGTIQPLIQRGEAGTLAQVYFVNGLNGAVQFTPNPNIFVADVLLNSGFSNYHSLQIEFRRRFSQGLQVQANYAWGKSLTDVGSSPNGGNDNQTRFSPLLDNAQPQLERSRADFDIPHTFKTNFLYELPFGPGKKFNPGNRIARKFVEGFQLSSIITWQSGNNLSFLSGRGTLNRGGRSTTTNTADTSLTNDQLKDLLGVFQNERGIFFINPSVIGRDGRAVAADGASPFSGQVFFNPNAGSVGSLERLAFNGPQQFFWDFSVIKRTTITESTNIEFRAEFFNVLNRAQFFIGNQNINSTNFGRITSTFDPRVIQFALKLNF